MVDKQLDEISDDLLHRIESAYVAGGYQLGWRLLYGPAATLLKADVAFLGLNPGGNEAPLDHAEFAMETGSAYETESWKGRLPGEENLQRQVRRLFGRIGVNPADVLAGNIVPFRSPSWAALSGSSEALAFGKVIWTEILERAQPKLVISMGGAANEATAEILCINDLRRVPVGWGTVTACQGTFAGGKLVGLPHLSRFPIIGRLASEAAISSLLDG